MDSSRHQYVTKDDRIQKVREASARGDIEYLRDALSDTDARSWAARYLGKLGATEAIPQLVRLLGAKDPKVRLASADALGMLGARQGKTELCSLAAADPSVAVRTHAIIALGNIGEPDTEADVIKLLSDGDWMVRDAAAVALGQFGTAAAIPTLEWAGRRRNLLTRRPYRRAIKEIRRRTR